MRSTSSLVSSASASDRTSHPARAAMPGRREATSSGQELDVARVGVRGDRVAERLLSSAAITGSSSGPTSGGCGRASAPLEREAARPPYPAGERGVVPGQQVDAEPELVVQRLDPRAGAVGVHLETPERRGALGRPALRIQEVHRAAGRPRRAGAAGCRAADPGTRGGRGRAGWRTPRATGRRPTPPARRGGRRPTPPTGGRSRRRGCRRRGDVHPDATGVAFLRGRFRPSVGDVAGHVPGRGEGSGSGWARPRGRRCPPRPRPPRPRRRRR